MTMYPVDGYSIAASKVHPSSPEIMKMKRGHSGGLRTAG
jgi:hypothetical protein